MANPNRFTVPFEAGKALEDAVAEANSRTSRQVIALAEVFAQGVAPSRRREMFEEVGGLAQRSTLNSYGQTVTRRKRAAGFNPYQRVKPQNVRFAGGKLKGALASKRFYRATPEGIDFINETVLNKAARHWMRLNAGAGRVGRGSKRRFEVRFSNLVVAALGVNMDPRPAFSMPRGFWFNRAEGQLVAPGANPRGTDEFYPVGEGPGAKTPADLAGSPRGRGRTRRGGRAARGSPTRGIEARNFLDAGVARIARELPIQYENLYARLWKDAVITGAKAGGPITGPRPFGGQRHIPSHVTTRSRYR